MNIRAMKQFFAKRIVSVLVPGAALGFLSLAAGSLQAQESMAGSWRCVGHFGFDERYEQ